MHLTVNLIWIKLLNYVITGVLFCIPFNFADKNFDIFKKLLDFNRITSFVDKLYYIEDYVHTFGITAS